MKILKQRIWKPTIFTSFIIIMFILAVLPSGLVAHAEEEGVDCVKCWTNHHVVDFSKHGEKKIVLNALVKNLNPKEKTLVRALFKVYDPERMQHLGTIMILGWIRPNAVRKFEVDFYFSEWGYEGPEMEYLIVVEVQYMDYEISPGVPHWAYGDACYLSFWVIEEPPVAVFTWTDIGGHTVQFDASESYDPDEKWGDYIAYYEWRIYVGWPYQQRFGEIATYTFDGPGEYYCRLYLIDTFGAVILVGFYVTVA